MNLRRTKFRHSKIRAEEDIALEIRKVTQLKLEEDQAHQRLVDQLKVEELQAKDRLAKTLKSERRDADQRLNIKLQEEEVLGKDRLGECLNIEKGDAKIRLKRPALGTKRQRQRYVKHVFEPKRILQQKNERRSS